MRDIKWLKLGDGIEIRNSGIPPSQEALQRKESLAGQSDAQKLEKYWEGGDGCLSTQASETANRDMEITNLPT